VANRQWFARRRYGFGVRPVSRQGWLITVLALGAAIGALVGVKKTPGAILFAGVVGLYLAVAYSFGGTKKRAVPDGGAGDAAMDDATTVAVAPEAMLRTIYGSQSPHEIAEAIVSRSGKFATPLGDENFGDAVIVVEHLTKQFGPRVAFEDVSFSVRRGEVFGFLGPNGAGKTTTVRMLSCLIGKTGGRAIVGGREIGRKEEVQEIRKLIGFLPENAGLYDDISAYKNLDYYGKLYECTETQRKERIEVFLKMLGLWEKRDVAAGTFSKGMKQKLSIARALIHDPQVLFLDEPTANLDPESSKAVRDFILDLKKEKRTIFINTHHLDEVEKTCDRIGILKTKLLVIGATDELLSSFWGRRTVVELARIEDAVVAAVKRLGYGDVLIEENRLTVAVSNPVEENPRLIESIVGAGGRILFVSELLPSLEEVYLKLVRN
jgi:ABC-2 type transport system ATP-binding protein